MSGVMSLYTRFVGLVSGKLIEGLALLFTRFALAGVFWRSGRTKVEDGSLFDITDTTYFLFENEYSKVPLPTDLSVHMATYSEHLFPILLVLGLATRLSALALLGMTLVIQFFVYPDAWWSVHLLWVAMAGILISRGAGAISLDSLFCRMRRG
ncbi:MAG: DoxX family protein [Erythrobacter sp.]|nr:DoxX family protein [Erythrobacter sp.]